MVTIWKFSIETTDKQGISMPEDAEILTVQLQHETPCIWAVVDSEKAFTRRLIEVFGTGHPMPDRERCYIGSYQLHGGELVFHVFEAIGELV